MAETALEVAQMSGLEGITDGKADAFRHAYWSTTMARDIGIKNAKIIGDNHEKYGSGLILPTEMDLYNNEVGRDAYEYLAKKKFDKLPEGMQIWLKINGGDHRVVSVSGEEIQEYLLHLIETGGMKYIKDGELVCTNQ